MNVNTILQSGVEGVQRANEGLEKAASEIVRAGSVDGPAGSTNSGVIEPHGLKGASFSLFSSSSLESSKGLVNR